MGKSAQGGSAQGNQAPKTDWSKGGKQVVTEEVEEEEDPDWIDFDPEKTRAKFFGHVMEDEQAIRQ